MAHVDLVPTCRNCGEPIKRETRHPGRSPSGWTHGIEFSSEGWQGLRCPGEITCAAPRDPSH